MGTTLSKDLLEEELLEKLFSLNNLKRHWMFASLVCCAVNPNVLIRDLNLYLENSSVVE
jgi:hypothetical protein